jgi:hypothetical protein
VRTSSFVFSGSNLDLKTKVSRHYHALYWITHRNIRHTDLRPTVQQSIKYPTGYLSRYADGLRDKRPGFDFSLVHNVQTGSGNTQPPIQWVSRVPSPGVKLSKLEANDSPPSSTEVKNGTAIPSFPIRLHGLVLN